MLALAWDIILDSFLDTIKLVPFLFLTYLVMEWLEHRTGTKTQSMIRKAGRGGPVIGGILGAFPQCGFSAAAANLYSGGLLTAGTVLAVYLSTSDEMLPIFISEAVPWNTIIKILVIKMVLGIVTGLLVDFLYHDIIRRRIRYKSIHTMCESEHCGCDDEGILPSAIKHTLQITLFIFLVTIILGCLLEGIGEENLSRAFLNIPILGELVAGLIGLIPNCASSVVITQLYLQGIIGIGPMMTGLLSGAGVGVLILFRMNRKRMKQNIGILICLYLTSVFWGILLEFLQISI